MVFYNFLWGGGAVALPATLSRTSLRINFHLSRYYTSYIALYCYKDTF
jgi:hypothetical protein